MRRQDVVYAGPSANWTSRDSPGEDPPSGDPPGDGVWRDIGEVEKGPDPKKAAFNHIQCMYSNSSFLIQAHVP